jgi:signal transduction histidine kinase/CheY-like chemotaxis protein/HPt (histidine-containing phosphotransfer) domain-containing protein
MWSSLKAGRSWTGEFHNRRKDGSEYIEAARISPLRLADGRVTHYVAVKEDITAKRRTEIELARHRHQLEELVRERTTQLEEARRHAEAANQAKSAFLANMSHEIRTPMNGVLGMLEVLAHGRLSEDQKELVRTAQESGRTLLGIIDDILDISKIEAGRMQIEHEAVALAEVVESLCETLIAGANLREVDLTFFVSPQIPARVRTDPLRLRQILLNLLGNAIKFSEGSRSRRGRVALRVTLGAQQPPQLVLTVADNGIGMSADVVARLFTPFTQAEASTTRRFGGSGLGLTICKRLVDLMGGAIQVQSQPQGGSTFTITLPCEPVAAAPARAFDLAGVRCVLIESPALDVDGLQAYLEHAGSIVLRAPTPRHALEACTVDSQSTVVIQDVALANRLEEDTFSEVPKGIRHLLITRGRRRRARLETPNVVVIDGPALRRDAFLQGVAVAAGRAPLGHTQEDETPKAGRGVFSPPSVADARDRSTLILVAEDDEVNQRVISKQLELLGRSAEIAQDGAKALRMWRAGGYALLLTDLHMPELDGYALCAAIRREEAQRPGDRPRLPIVALTANALRGEADRARAVGIDDYLTKPLQLELLRDTLNRWLPPADARDRPPTATPATHRATPAIDVSALISLVGDDQQGLRSLLATFLRSMANVDIDLGRACTEGNAQQIRSIVHKLKSAARSVGAIALADLSLAIEQAAMANDLPSVRALMPAFTTERQRVVAAINAHLGSAQD